MLFKAYKSTETVAQLIKHTVALHLQHTYYNYWRHYVYKII